VSDLPLVPGPVYGLRTWTVVGEPGHELLAGPHRTTPWPTGGALLEAECSATPAHTPPGTTCTCGLHALHPTRASARRVCSVRREVPGILEASGAVEVHADGFRAQRGRPYALVLVRNGNAHLFERLAEAYDAELLRLNGPDALVAYCRDRGLGLGEDVVAELVDTESVAAARRRRRRRWALTIVGLIAAALALAGIVRAIDPGTEHGKVLKGRGGEVTVP
jgi:hypothetical protein